jgi:hypothetical protein
MTNMAEAEAVFKTKGETSMKNTWKKVLLAGLSATLFLAGCGGGNPDKTKKSDLPTRKKISTPIAATFKVKDRESQIYEYTGLTFKDRTIMTEIMGATDNTIYFFGYDPKVKKYTHVLRQIRYKDEKISDMKVIDPRAAWTSRMFISNGTVYDFHKPGDYANEPKGKKSSAYWHYYDGHTMQPTKLFKSVTPINQGKDVVYEHRFAYYSGTLDKGTITEGKKIISMSDVQKDRMIIKNTWADSDGFYLMGTKKEKDGKYFTLVRHYSMDGKLLNTFEGPLNDNQGGYAVTEHRVVFGTKDGEFWVYNKKSGELLGKGATNPKLGSKLLVPLKNDCILMLHEVSGLEAKLYRIDL